MIMWGECPPCGGTLPGRRQPGVWRAGSYGFAVWSVATGPMLTTRMILTTFGRGTWIDSWAAFSKRLRSGSERNGVVNWMGVVKWRIREFLAGRRPESRPSVPVGALSVALASKGKNRMCRKLLPILPLTREPRTLSRPGFSVNWCVAQVCYF